ncbi:MAG: hypothetical protein O6932_09505 [Gammaproteobacteria bacterium]|nr:hypothetical protein [Gammaproteobacteria bacterium]
MNRLLYFTGYRMVAQEWLGRKLESSVYFEPDDQGLDLFSAYLRSFRGEPVRLMVDLIEEEFRQVKIPFLRGGDRRAILKRNYAKYFRNSRYRHAISQSVEKKTRKEENLLLMGLTNQYLLEPWLKIIEDTRTPLSGIVSLPLVSQDYVAELESANKAVILVSQQVPSNLRQSVFVNGKLILSRLVPIASFYQGDYAADLIRDIESTQRYLVSQRIVERAEGISIQIFTNKRHFEKLKIKCAAESYTDFKIYQINDLLKREKIEIYDDQDFSSGLFCYLASKKVSANHYAQHKEKRYYRYHVANMIMKFASIAFVSIGIGLTLTSLTEGWIYNNSVTEMELIERKYKSKFTQLNENTVESTVSTATMRDIVEVVEVLQKRYMSDPEELLSLVSRDISLFSDIRVKKVEWFASRHSDAETADEVSWGKGSTSRKKKKKKKKSASSKKTTNPKAYYEIATVEGQFLNFDGDYRYALSTVDDLETALKESGNYLSVEITKRPLDIEPENTLAGDVSAKANPREPVAELAFRVVREISFDD